MLYLDGRCWPKKDYYIIHVNIIVISITYTSYHCVPLSIQGRKLNAEFLNCYSQEKHHLSTITYQDRWSFCYFLITDSSNWKVFVCRTLWKKCCFSGDGEYIVAGSAKQHSLYIWEKAVGNLVKMLPGTKGELLLDVVVRSCSFYLLIDVKLHPIVVKMDTRRLNTGNNYQRKISKLLMQNIISSCCTWLLHW